MMIPIIDNSNYAIFLIMGGVVIMTGMMMTVMTMTRMTVMRMMVLTKMMTIMTGQVV